MKKIKIINYFIKDLKDKEEPFNTFTNWDDIQHRFITQEGIAEQITPNKTKYTICSSSTEEDFNDSNINILSTYLIQNKFGYKIRSGVSLNPTDLLTFYSDSNTKIITKPRITPTVNVVSGLIGKNKSKYIKVNHGANKYDFEEELLHPYIKAPDLKSLSKISKCERVALFPFDFEKNHKAKEKTLLNQKELLQSYPLVSNFYNLYKDQMATYTQRTDGRLVGKDFYSPIRVGKYSFNKKHIILRDNTKWIVSLVNEEVNTNYGVKKYPFFEGHVRSISERVDYNDTKKIIGTISDDNELYYVSGILSTDIVRDYILSSNSVRGFHLDKMPFYLPHYDANNCLHLKIANCVNDVFNGKTNLSLDIYNTLNELYKELIEVDFNKTLKPYTRKITRELD